MAKNSSSTSYKFIAYEAYALSYQPESERISLSAMDRAYKCEKDLTATVALSV